MGDQPLLKGQAMAFIIMMKKFDLHLCHVNTGRALALAAFARNAQVERLLHLRRGKCAWPELAGDREAQRVGTTASDVLLLTGGAIRRTHCAAQRFPTSAVIVAHLDSLAEAPPFRPIEGRFGGFNSSIAWRKAHQASVIHTIRPDDLARVKSVFGIKPILYGLERV